MPELQVMGRWLVVLGLAIVATGALFWGAGKLGLGSLPGDFKFGSGTWGCYVPLATLLLISLVLTLVLNLLIRWFGR